MAAGCLLLVERVAVARRTALDDVRDVYPRAVKVDHLQHIVEQLSGGTDKRLALQILVFARCLAYEHHARMRVAHAEHRLRAAVAQRAAAA